EVAAREGCLVSQRGSRRAERVAAEQAGGASTGDQRRVGRVHKRLLGIAALIDRAVVQAVADVANDPLVGAGHPAVGGQGVAGGVGRIAVGGERVVGAVDFLASELKREV